MFLPGITRITGTSYGVVFLDPHIGPYSAFLIADPNFRVKRIAHRMQFTDEPQVVPIKDGHQAAIAQALSRTTMNPMILLTALSVGQLPAGGPPTPTPYFVPAIPSVNAAPGGAQPPMTLPTMTSPGTTVPDAGGSTPQPDEKQKVDDPKPDEPQPYALERLLRTTQFGQRLGDWGVSVSGWSEGNYTASTARRSNLPLTFNDRADFWQFNQNYLKIEKAVDTSKDEFQLGFRTDYILPGTDARFSIARGFLNGQLKPTNADGSLPNYYPIDIFQFYGEAFMPNVGPKGTSVKVGRFATHVGYELVQGAETPFLQRSYLFQYNPFTHTGAWATTPLNDTWTVSNGLSLGADNFIGAPSRLTYLGQLKWAPKDGKTNVAFNVVLTDPRYDVRNAFPFYNVYNMVLTHNFTDKFSYVLDTAFSHIDGIDAGTTGGPGSATWYGAANYFIYKVNDKLTSTLRAEVFEDTKGFRTGSKGLYTEVTYGVAWSPVRSLILRPTVRYDYNGTSRPFEGKANLFTAAMDVIVRW